MKIPYLHNKKSPLAILVNELLAHTNDSLLPIVLCVNPSKIKNLAPVLKEQENSMSVKHFKYHIANCAFLVIN